MASMLSLALALALKHLCSYAFMYSSEFNGDGCVRKAKPRQFSGGAEPLVSFGK